MPDHRIDPIAGAAITRRDGRPLAALCRISEGYLRDTDPQASAFHRLNRLHRIVGALALGSVVLALALAFEKTLQVFSVVCIALFLALAITRLAMLLPPERAPQEPGRRKDTELPVYTILVPAFREACRIEPLTSWLLSLDYPKDRLDIILLVEAEDGPTCQAARRAAARHRSIRAVELAEGHPRTKPRALNVGLILARGDFLTIYDAEDRPHWSQLRAALSRFEEDEDHAIGVLQAPLFWWNARENALTRQLQIEYLVQFRLVLPALAAWKCALPLGGTSNHFRIGALRHAGGWDPYNVTEDADLGFRLAAHGWKSDVIEPPTSEEAVTTVAAWLRQRRRWLKGFMQTWLVAMRCPRRLVAAGGWRSLFALNVTLMGSLGAAFLHAPFFLLLACAGAAKALGLAHAPLLSESVLMMSLAGYGSAFLATAATLIRAGERDLLRHMLLMPGYWLLHSVAAIHALADLIGSPHHWLKTSHGVSSISEKDPVQWLSPVLSPLDSLPSARLAVPPSAISWQGAPSRLSKDPR